VTILPPPDQRDTEPPEKSRDSTLPPADLGPTGIALRLLALEEQVADIHMETMGIGESIRTMRMAMVEICDAYRGLALDLRILLDDARKQRIERQGFRRELDEIYAAREEERQQQQ